jgi:hypothetical protein
MAADAASILAALQDVDVERQARAADTALAQRVLALKQYQHRRCDRSHAESLGDPRFSAAARFFLDDLYGPQDFSARDAQFARIVPALVRLFPQEIVETVQSMAALHVLSERLDTAMARHLSSPALSRVDYVSAWQATGQADARRRQLAQVMALGEQLARYTRHRWLRHSLRLMRKPAQAAGLGDLQAFLERGFDTFAAMRDASDFLARVQQRETALMQRLFEADAVAAATGPTPAVTDAIGQLP